MACIDEETATPAVTPTPPLETVSDKMQKPKMVQVDDIEIAYNILGDGKPIILNKSTLLIAGTEDVIVPPKNSLIMVEQIPGAWLVQIEGGGHGLMYQYPEKISNITLSFLEN